jgi:glycosyltransferase involved in cell wall biosynthesis
VSVSGVLWAGPLYDRGGYGNVSRNYVRSLLGAGIPVRAVNVGPFHDDIDHTVAGQIRKCEETLVGKTAVGIVHSTPDIFRFMEVLGTSNLISASLFETHAIPRAWVPWCNAVDQVWVPSRFNAHSYARSGVRRRKIRVVHYPVDCEYYHPGVVPSSIPGANGFVFLYVFAFNWRKGFDLLLRAYGREFTNADDVTLVLKVAPGIPTVPDVAREILESARPDYDPSSPDMPNVVLLTQAMRQEQIRDLYASCDLYISTDRANGWGMPCAEAMAMGKPAATINWSGSTEFMNEDTALLIEPSSGLEPVDVRLEDFPYGLYRGQKWARVDVAEVRRVMRLAFEDRSLLQEKAERGAEYVRRNLSLQRIGDRLKKILAETDTLERGAEDPGIRLLPIAREPPPGRKLRFPRLLRTRAGRR